MIPTWLPGTAISLSRCIQPQQQPPRGRGKANDGGRWYWCCWDPHQSNGKKPMSWLNGCVSIMTTTLHWMTVETASVCRAFPIHFCAGISAIPFYRQNRYWKSIFSVHALKSACLAVRRSSKKGNRKKYWDKCATEPTGSNSQSTPEKSEQNRKNELKKPAISRLFSFRTLRDKVFIHLPFLIYGRPIADYFSFLFKILCGIIEVFRRSPGSTFNESAILKNFCRKRHDNIESLNYTQVITIHHWFGSELFLRHSPHFAKNRNRNS